MYYNPLKLKRGVICWHQFSRRSDAAFLSMGREIVIRTLSVATLLCVVPMSVAAQTASPQQADTLETVALESVEVTASRVPMPMEQAARLVSVITREQIENAPAQSVNDLLKQSAAIDVRQRGAFGIQTDISLNGGTHDQLVLLLNGVNISSPHTGHLAADFPISIDDIERIEVLEGAASRIYGTSAFSGAINIVTSKGNTSNESASKGSGYSQDSSSSRKRLSSSGSIALHGGSYGTFGGDASWRLSSSHSYHTLSLGYQQSDGGTDNSDFAKGRLYYSGGWRPEEMEVDWQFGYSQMDYGASTFYSGKYPDQWEEDERYTASISAKTHGRVSLAPTLYFNRAYDHYQLIKDSSTGENYHRTDVYGASLNAQVDWQAGTTALGAEIRQEGILSTSLGKDLSEDLYVGIHGADGYYTQKDTRTNICYFLEHDLVLRRWTFSLGVMANMNTSLDHKYRLYPGIDIAWRPSSSWKLYASFNMAQRMPTFTDLYYKSPTNEGNTGLQPEETTEYALGGAFHSKGWSIEARLFYRHQRDMIDWIMTPADSVNGYTTYHAANFKVDNLGGTLQVGLALQEWLGSRQPLQALRLNYAYIHQKRHDDVEVYASSYALDYLRHKVTASLDVRLCNQLTATLSYRWQQRMGNYVHYASDGSTQTRGYHPYSLLDARVQWDLSRWQLYVEGSNLLSHRYYDLGNVQQPGFWLMAGAKIRI